MPPQQPKKHAIPTTTAALMLVTALLFDGLQFGTDLMHALPLIGTVAQSIADILISVWAWLTFYVWFKIHGVTFMNAKRFAVLNGGALIEMIPIVNSLPAWTLAVFLLIGITRAEELLAKIPGGRKIAAIARRAGGRVRRQPMVSALKSGSETPRE